ncbi:glycosyltransferase [Exiguobacterium sp. s91]|uniref:glycosyltransferase n=1 Tax=Exiguobacterium sp. s91 TaxID=2751199 RepID=UPI001BED3AA5|nr:glycosyltransferase [Exiguobacterium sp. s91]
MKNFVVLTNGYPSESNKYSNGFVHSRVLGYKKRGVDGIVIVLNKKTNLINSYEYEGVTVFECHYSNVKEIIPEYIEKIFIHFVDEEMIKTLRELKRKLKIYIWIHGTEALSWKRRTYNLGFNIFDLLRFLKYMYFNRKQMKFMKKLIKDTQIDKHFIFVSKWMKEILEKDTDTVIDKNFDIIPNPIDSEVFDYQKKTEDLRLKILSIRPYSSKKYANDITVKVIKKLMKKPFFNELEINIYGAGRLFKKTNASLKKYQNINLNETFLSQKDISKLHKKNGILLIPTRQDAQGVSMCEGISSGLVPITSNNSAIPEFVESNFGYVCNNIEEYVSAIEEMYYSSDVYLKKSSEGFKFIQEKCGDNVFDKELLITGVKKDG